MPRAAAANSALAARNVRLGTRSKQDRPAGTPRPPAGARDVHRVSRNRNESGETAELGAPRRQKIGPAAMEIRHSLRLASAAHPDKRRVLRVICISARDIIRRNAGVKFWFSTSRFMISSGTSAKSGCFALRQSPVPPSFRATSLWQPPRLMPPRCRYRTASDKTSPALTVNWPPAMARDICRSLLLQRREIPVRINAEFDREVPLCIADAEQAVGRLSRFDRWPASWHRRDRTYCDAGHRTTDRVEGIDDEVDPEFQRRHCCPAERFRPVLGFRHFFERRRRFELPQAHPGEFHSVEIKLAVGVSTSKAA